MDAQELEEAPFPKDRSHPLALSHVRFAMTAAQSLLEVTKRQLTMTLRDKVLLKGRMIQVCVWGGGGGAWGGCSLGDWGLRGLQFG